jgi:hypothetical protein
LTSKRTSDKPAQKVNNIATSDSQLRNPQPDGARTVRTFVAGNCRTNRIAWPQTSEPQPTETRKRRKGSDGSGRTLQSYNDLFRQLASTSARTEADSAIRPNNFRGGGSQSGRAIGGSSPRSPLTSPPAATVLLTHTISRHHSVPIAQSHHRPLAILRFCLLDTAVLVRLYPPKLRPASCLYPSPPHRSPRHWQLQQSEKVWNAYLFHGHPSQASKSVSDVPAPAGGMGIGGSARTRGNTSCLENGRGVGPDSRLTTNMR